MTEYILRVKRLRADGGKRVEIPEDAIHISTEYLDSTRLHGPTNTVVIIYLEPAEDDR